MLSEKQDKTQILPWIRGIEVYDHETNTNSYNRLYPQKDITRLVLLKTTCTSKPHQLT